MSAVPEKKKAAPKEPRGRLLDFRGERRTERLTIRVTPTLLNAIVEGAAAADREPSEFARTVLQKALLEKEA